jgi:hypothetical protein
MFPAARLLAEGCCNNLPFEADFREESRLSSLYGRMNLRRKGAKKNVLQHQTIHRIEINANFVTGKQTKQVLWKMPFLQWIWARQAAAPS